MTTRLQELRALRQRVDEEIRRETRRLKLAAEFAETVPEIHYPDPEPDPVEAVTSTEVLSSFSSLEAAAAGLASVDRRPAYAEARLVVMWLLRQQGHSYPAIGRLIARDHTTARSGVLRVNADETLMQLADTAATAWSSPAVGGAA